MKQIRNFELITFFALTSAATAQVGPSVWPVSVGVTAARNYVVAARGLQVNARSLNSRGAILRGRTFQWQVSDPARASIDATGVLRGLAPGAVDVTATDVDGGISGTSTFYVYPDKIVVAGGSLSLQAGDTLKLSAQVLDADGNPVSNVPIQWAADLPALASISADGVLTGVAEGRVTVTASLAMGAAFSRFNGFANVDIVRRADFRLKSVISTDAASGATTLVPTRVSASGNFAAAISSLSNGGQGLLLWQNSSLRLLSSSGAVLDGRVITHFEGVSVNIRGDVLALADTQAQGCSQALLLFTAAAHWAMTVLDETGCNYSPPTPNSLDAQGGFVFRYRQSLYYRKPDGTTQTIVSYGDKPGGISPIVNITNWSISRFGTVLLEVSNSSNQPVYFSWNGAKLQKLFSIGENIGGDFTQFARLPVEASPGEFITRTGGSNWAALARFRDGSWSLIARSGRDNVGWIQDGYDSVDGDIYYFADYSVAGKNVTAVLRNSGSGNSVVSYYSSYREATQINALGGGSILIAGTMDGPVPRAVRMTGSSTITIFGPGITVIGTPAPALGLVSIPKGLNPAGAVLHTWGDTLLRSFSPGVTTLLKPGDSLPSGHLASLYTVATNRLGDAVFTAQHGTTVGLYAYRNGQIQVFADSGDQIDGSNLNGFATYSDSQIAMNNQGHVAVHLYTSGGEGIYLLSGGGTPGKNVMRVNGIAPGSAASFTGIQQVAIDDNDRVGFIASLNNGKTGFFLWDQGTLKPILETGQQDLTGRSYNGLNAVQAAGSRFFVRGSAPGLTECLMIDGVSPKLLVTEGYTTSFGMVVTGFFDSEMAANSRGDLVIPVLTPSGPAVFVKRTNGKDSLVAVGSQRGPEDEWFLQMNGVGISEQGDIIFGAQTWAGDHIRFGVYQAVSN